MPKNQTKIRLICTAPKHITTYNEEWNKTVREKCLARIMFQPEARPECIECEYMKVKTYK